MRCYVILECSSCFFYIAVPLSLYLDQLNARIKPTKVNYDVSHIADV